MENRVIHFTLIKAKEGLVHSIQAYCHEGGHLRVRYRNIRSDEWRTFPTVRDGRPEHPIFLRLDTGAFLIQPYPEAEYVPEDRFEHVQGQLTAEGERFEIIPFLDYWTQLAEDQGVSLGPGKTTQ